jgi:hypothetical protein
MRKKGWNKLMSRESLKRIEEHNMTREVTVVYRKEFLL